MSHHDKEGSFAPIIFVLTASLIIASFWNKIPALKNSVHAILDPSAGALISWNLNLGMLLLVFCIALFTSLVQKYATDQKTLKELREEQKVLQEEMKKYKAHPEKLFELQKKQLEIFPKTMKLSMRALTFTGIPFILFFRWFDSYFESLGDPTIFGFFSWFWFYLVFAILFGSILRKVLKIV
jgi:uncharacterized membrane protein (DUF106 family)